MDKLSVPLHKGKDEDIHAVIQELIRQHHMNKATAVKYIIRQFAPAKNGKPSLRPPARGADAGIDPDLFNVFKAALILEGKEGVFAALSQLIKNHV